MTPRSRRLACTGWLSHRFLVSVLLVGVAGIALPGPGRALDNAGAINVTLAVLVFTTGLSMSASGLSGLRHRWRRIAVVIGASTVTLPALAWAASRLVAGPSRDGILTLGVAPAEVASVALTELAGGDVLVTVSILVASVLVTVLTAGPILHALGAHSRLHASSLLEVLTFVVGAPLVLGAGASSLSRHRRQNGRPQDGHPQDGHPQDGRKGLTAPGALTGSIALLVLLWEVASEVHLHAAPSNLAAVASFIVGAYLIGWLLGRGLNTLAGHAILLPIAMRDFAVAAGIAATAFGPASAGPLGLYGVVVLLGGTAYATLARRAAPSPS